MELDYQIVKTNCLNYFSIPLVSDTERLYKLMKDKNQGFSFVFNLLYDLPFLKPVVPDAILKFCCIIYQLCVQTFILLQCVDYGTHLHTLCAVSDCVLTHPQRLWANLLCETAIFAFLLRLILIYFPILYSINSFQPVTSLSLSLSLALFGVLNLRLVFVCYTLT